MTLQETAQILGGIGVIASLIYVAIQIRNNARATRAATYQQVSGAPVALWGSLAANAEMMELVLKSGDDFASLDRVGKARMRMATMAYMRRYENAWFQRKVGTLREQDWQAVLGDLEALMSVPGTREIWALVKNRSGAEFRTFVDAMAARHAAKAGE